MIMQFANVQVLYLLWLAPLLGLAWYGIAKRRRAALSRFVAPELLARLGPSNSHWRVTWQIGLFTGGAFLILIALARPQWGTREEVVFQRGRDLMIAIDVSRSMLARDVHPNRLERAKVDIKDLLRELHGDRVGLIAFRGTAVMLCPLTTDYAFFAQTLDNLSIESAPAGTTSLGDPIRKTITAFESDAGSHKALVLVSDGEDLAGDSITAAEAAKTRGTAIFTVGLGNPDGSRIPDAKNDGTYMNYQGQEVVTKLDNETMRKIAALTGGAYIPVGMANVNLGMLYRDHLSRIQATEQEEAIRRRYIERYQYFLFPGLLLLLAAAMLSRGRISAVVRRTARTNPVPIPPIPAAVVLALLIPLTGVMAQSNVPISVADVSDDISITNNGAVSMVSTNQALDVPAGRDGGRIAQALYRKGQFEKSAIAYEAAARRAPQTLQNQMIYNKGVALYKAGQFKEASDTFRDLMQRERAEVLSAAFNRGVALYGMATATNAGDDAFSADETRSELLRQSGEAFQRALRAKTDHAGSRASLAAVLDRMPEADERARIARLMKQYGQTAPDALADMLLLNQRALITRINDAYTNDVPRFISAMELLADEQRANADLLVPLKGQIMNALTAQNMAAGSSNQAVMTQQIGMLNQHVEVLRDQMGTARSAIRDLDRGATYAATKAATATYPLWKAVVNYPQLLREDILQQTNLIDITTRTNPPRATNATAVLGEHQNESLSLTRLFVERFKAGVPEEGLYPPQAPPATPAKSAQVSTPAEDTSSTNVQPLISRENRVKVLELSDLACAAQIRAATLVVQSDPKPALPDAREAYRLLCEIEKLLPKDQSQSQQQNQQEQKEQQDQKDQQEQKEKQQQSQPQQQKQEQQQPKPEQPQKDEKKDKQEMSEEEIQRLLEKARQREKEHQEELRQRSFYNPLPPSERDW